MTLTPDGITLRVKRHHRKIDIPWDRVIGAAAMVGDNEGILTRGADIILTELGYKEYLRSIENESGSA